MLTTRLTVVGAVASVAAITSLSSCAPDTRPLDVRVRDAITEDVSDVIVDYVSSRPRP